MGNRSFFLWMAMFVMLLGAAAGMIKEGGVKTDKTADVSAPVQKESCILPVEGEITGRYGAVYSDEVKQWTMQEETVVRTEEGGEIRAPMSGRVIDAAADAGGGGRICIEGNGLRIEIYPVYGIRVFEGSSLEQGNIMGISGKYLNIRVEDEEGAVDFMSLIEHGETDGESKRKFPGETGAEAVYVELP